MCKRLWGWRAAPRPKPVPPTPWPAYSPLDPAVARFAGAARYLVWRRDQDWTAVIDGLHWGPALAPRWWAWRHRHWRLLVAGMGVLGSASGLWLAGAFAGGWLLAWAALGLVELGMRAYTVRQASRWRCAALQRAGWQPVTQLRAISVEDAVTTARIRSGELRPE
ncbi:hypothetical protein VDG05_05510 [Xanthomonas campestris pv. raphani]|uniref:hypothetical protein n=1 Tax=Xanthomonas campestris TaxID=339 RepID=UPI002B2353D2|nr:hypothetical protein [Xanthomonas campestris]MEA9883812.1 hypothetical protein [Xanthomonas campestris pv. raphani]